MVMMMMMIARDLLSGHKCPSIGGMSVARKGVYSECAVLHRGEFGGVCCISGHRGTGGGGATNGGLWKRYVTKRDNKAQI